MTSVVNINGTHLIDALPHLSIDDQGEMQTEEESHEKVCSYHGGVCAICLDDIVLQETALVKGCEHAYCVTCILRWVTYSNKPTCPQCKHPFEFLSIHRTLDGCIQDYLFEESVCLLLRATWFKPLIVEEHKDVFPELEEIYFHQQYEYEYEDVEDDLDEVYFSSSLSNIRIGNRRWGDNGYVRGGRQEARPVTSINIQDFGAGSSREPRKKEAVQDKTGRRAKRTLKREAADRAAAAKHQQRLVRLGRKTGKENSEAGKENSEVGSCIQGSCS